MSYYNCSLMGVDNLPNQITITIPAILHNITNRFSYDPRTYTWQETLSVNTGFDLSKYTVTGGTVSGTNITISRTVTAVERSSTYIEVSAPAVTVTATKK